MFNPFKKSFLIEKIENLKGESFFTVQYGWLWSADYISSYGNFSFNYSESVCNFSNLEEARIAIRKFSERELEKRLSKTTATQSYKI